jgi:hypothetical protein
MSIEDADSRGRNTGGTFGEFVALLCARPQMFVADTNFHQVVAFIDGFNAARDGGPLLGFREWLVVRANTGDNLGWASLLKLVVPPPPESEVGKNQEEYWNQVAGNLIAEYLRYRNTNGITKLYYEYGQWLLRKRWYQGPLRRKPPPPGSSRSA